MGTKICSRCKKEKDFNEFPKNNRTKSGLQSWCKSCYREYKKEYSSRPEIKSRISEYGKEYYRRDGVKEHRKIYSKTKVVKERQKEYRNRPEVKEHRSLQGKEYREKPEKKERLKIKKRVYTTTPRGKASSSRGHSKRRTKERILKNDLTSEQWEEIIKMQNNICAICEKPFTELNPPTRDHIIPLSNPACPGLTRGNVQAVHKNCNSSKGNKINFGNSIDNLLI
jgi:5-methylcytosine-specific restriction endonuclease McrA